MDFHLGYGQAPSSASPSPQHMPDCPGAALGSLLVESQPKAKRCTCIAVWVILGPDSPSGLFWASERSILKQKVSLARWKEKWLFLLTEVMDHLSLGSQPVCWQTLA